MRWYTKHQTITRIIDAKDDVNINMYWYNREVYHLKMVIDGRVAITKDIYKNHKGKSKVIYTNEKWFEQMLLWDKKRPEWYVGSLESYKKTLDENDEEKDKKCFIYKLQAQLHSKNRAREIAKYKAKLDILQS